MSAGAHEAAQTLAAIASELAGNGDGEHAGQHEEGPHQTIRRQVLKRLDITMARAEVEYDGPSKARQFVVGDCVGIKVDRIDRGAVHRTYIPCLVAHINA